MLILDQVIESTLKLTSFIKLNKFHYSYFETFGLMKLLELENEIDKKLGLHYKDVEKNLQNSSQVYSESYIENDLEALALNTSYLDLIQIFIFLNIKPTQHFIDIGAGYARSALLINILYPQTKATALEHVKERVEKSRAVSKKLNLPLDSYHCQDILNKNYSLPQGDYYFLYLPLGELLHKSIKDLKENAKTRDFKIIAIESHGELINRLNKEDWLNKIDCPLQTISPRHDQNIYIFETNRKKLNQIKTNLQRLEDLVYNAENDFQIIIRDKDLGNKNEYHWSASSKDLTFNLIDKNFEKLDLLYPPRTISIDQIITVEKKELPPFYKEREDNLKIKLKQIDNEEFKSAGWIRKIIVHPELIIEFSVLGRIPYCDIRGWDTV